MSRSSDEAVNKAGRRIRPGWSWIVAGALCAVIGCCVCALYLRYRHEAAAAAAAEAEARAKAADIERYGSKDSAVREYERVLAHLYDRTFEGFLPVVDKDRFGPTQVNLDRDTGRWTVTQIAREKLKDDFVEVVGEDKLEVILSYSSSDGTWRTIQVEYPKVRYNVP